MSFKASKSREQLCLRLKSIGVVPRFSMSASMSDKKDDLYESTAKNCLFSKQKSIQHTHKLRKSLKLFRKTFEKIQTSTNTRLYFQHVLVLIYLPHCTSTKKWRVRKQCLGKTIHLGNEDSTKNDLNLFLPLPFLTRKIHLARVMKITFCILGLIRFLKLFRNVLKIDRYESI